MFNDYDLLIPIVSKGRAAQFIVKGPTKKRTKAEFDEIHAEKEELKADQFGFLKRHKRMKQEMLEMHNSLVDLKGGPQLAS